MNRPEIGRAILCSTLVEWDTCGVRDHPGQPSSKGRFSWVWGYDETGYGQAALPSWASMAAKRASRMGRRAALSGLQMLFSSHRSTLRS